MNQGSFFQNPDFAIYVRLLGRLHRLIRDERDETAEGDALRDEMDRPGEALSDEEGREVSAISTDLYSIHEQEAPIRFEGAGPPPVLRDVIDAISGRDAVNALTILRQHADEIPPDVLAHFRGQAFAAVEQFEIAADFFEQSTRLAPDNPFFGVFWLEALLREDLSRARTLSRDIVRRRAEYSPILVVEAAFISLGEILGSLEGQGDLNELREALYETAVRLESLGAPDETLAGVYLALGQCEWRLGAIEDARRDFDRALEFDANFAEALAARGILLFGDGENPAAVDDLRRSVELGCSLSLPFLLLAHHSQLHGQFDDCLRFANAALHHETDSELRACSLHYMAIAMAHLGYPPPAVRAVFQDAIQLAPNIDEFQGNMERFEESLRNQTATPPQWVSTHVNRIQSFVAPRLSGSAASRNRIHGRHGTTQRVPEHYQ